MIIVPPAMKVDTHAHVAEHIYVFVGYTVVLVFAAVYMTSAIRRAEVAARRRLHLQAWQLRQLVPMPIANA